MEHVTSSLEEGWEQEMRQRQWKGKEPEHVSEEKREGDGNMFTFETCEFKWRCPTSNAMVGVHNVKPKLCSTRGMFFSSQESTQSLKELETEDKSDRPWEAAEQEPGPCEHLDPKQNQADVRGGKAEQGKGSTQGVKKGKAEKRNGEEGELGKEKGVGGPRRNLWRIRDKEKEKWKVRRRERLGGSVEVEGGDGERTERESSKRWSRTVRDDQEGSETGADGEQDGAWGTEVEQRPERFLKGEIVRGGSIRHTVLSHMLMHSSASSSSSSINCSSAESDEVFSEEEATGTRRPKMRKSHSWKPFLAMMQWSVRRPSSWVQLAGHQGNFRVSEGGEVLKRYNAVESSCLQALMSDSLRQFVPCYHGSTTREREIYIRLEDLLSGLTCPVIMDCKMGVRTYLEDELARERSSPCLRTDMYQKMVRVEPTAPSAEEHAQGSVTKPRYMQWRDSVSSSSTLGFRIEGVTVEDGRVLRNFKKTQSSAQVTDVLLSFTKRQSHILEAYLSRLQALNDALKESEFFKSHEIIGSSLLFAHDHTNKANIWMIDFGKTTPTPSGVQLKHNIPWVEGNREDGYIIGLTTLTLLVTEALRQAREQDHIGCSVPAQVDHRPETQSWSKPAEVVHDPIQNLQLQQSIPSAVCILQNDAASETCGNGPQSKLDLTEQKTVMESRTQFPLSNIGSAAEFCDTSSGLGAAESADCESGSGTLQT